MLKLLLHILLDSECLCQNHVIFLFIRMTKSFTQKKICLVELRMACSVDVYRLRVSLIEKVNR